MASVWRAGGASEHHEPPAQRVLPLPVPPRFMPSAGRPMPAGVAVFALLNTLNLLWLVKLVAMARAGDQQQGKQQQRQNGGGWQPAAGAAGKPAPQPGVAITAFAGSVPKQD